MAEVLAYQWRPQLVITSGGYTGEARGIYPPGSEQSWTTSASDTGSQTYSYYYTDSNNADNSNSSRVVVTVTDSWTVSFDANNVMTVTVNSTITNIERKDITGNPHAGGTATRDLTIKRYKEGQVIWRQDADDISTAHTIVGVRADGSTAQWPYNIGTHTYTINPQATGEERGTVFFRNHTTGYPEETRYTDAMQMGIFFRNIQEVPPKDYRPGKVEPDGTWMSCNRSGGACKIYNGSNWVEMRTIHGGVDSDNPPLIAYSTSDDSWKNMRLIGTDSGIADYPDEQ